MREFKATAKGTHSNSNPMLSLLQHKVDGPTLSVETGGVADVVSCWLLVKKETSWGAWVAPLVQRSALYFSLGHELRIGRLSPTSCSVLSLESA